MSHLGSIGWGFVHLERSLVFPVDCLVCKEPGGGYHRSSHTVSEEENDVLSLVTIGERFDFPAGMRLRPIVVGEDNVVLARLM